MTLPPEDRDLIERVLGYDADENVKTLLLTRSDLSNLLAAVRAEAAPVVDDGMVERAAEAAWSAPVSWARLADSSHEQMKTLMQYALPAALGASQ